MLFRSIPRPPHRQNQIFQPYRTMRKRVFPLQGELLRPIFPRTWWGHTPRNHCKTRISAQSPRNCSSRRPLAHPPASRFSSTTGIRRHYTLHPPHPQSMGRKFCASTHGEAHFTPLEPSAAKHTHRRNACALFHAHRQQRQANAADCAQNARQQKEALPPPHRHPQD